MIIYAAIAPNGKRYVGQTINTLAYRRAQHRRHKSQSLFAKALRKYGAEFDWEIIDTANSQAELNYKEQYWIAKLNTMYPHGYNLQAGGDSGRHSETTIAKMRRAATGKSPSAESRMKMRMAKLGKPLSPKAKAAHARKSAAQVGVKASPAHCAAISKSLIGNTRAAK